MSTLDAIKQSGLQSITKVIGSYSLVTEASGDGHLHVYFSNGDSVLSADLGDTEIGELQVKLGLNNKQGVMNLIGSALKDLQHQQPAATAATVLAIPLARGSQREADLRLTQPANQSEARRRLFALLAGRARDLAAELEASSRSLEAARAGKFSGDALGLKRLGGGCGAVVGKRVARTVLPGMSLVNPMQRKRKAAKGVVFDDEEDGEDEDDEGKDEGQEGGKD